MSLSPIDGETITNGVQSNLAGNGFYTRNGFTRAASWAGAKPGGGNYAGFDDPDFFPISTWLTDPIGQPATTYGPRLQTVGTNGFLPASGAINFTDAVTYGFWAVATTDSNPAGSITDPQDPAVIGVSSSEEPSTVVQYENAITEARTWLATSEGTGRFHMYNFTHNLLNGDVEFHYYAYDMVISWMDSDASNRSRRIFLTCDNYWMTDQVASIGPARATLNEKVYQHLTGSLPSFTELNRGSHYGSSLDCIRKQFSAGGNSPPGGPINYWIETGAPYGEAECPAITPAQLKWCVWAELVHGARSIGYFNGTFRAGDPHTTSNVLLDDWYGGPGVTGTGIFAGVQEVNTNAIGIARVLNSPKDGYFVWGDTGSTGNIADTGFLTAVTSTNVRSAYAGVDATCRWVPSERKHYILSTTREAEASTSIPVTFRMVDQGQTTATRLHDTTGSISISRGGGIPSGYCEFSDTFATAASYKTYRID